MVSFPIIYYFLPGEFYPSAQRFFLPKDGSFRVISLDQKAIFTLAPHGRSYVVQWWQATANQPTTGHRGWRGSWEIPGSHTWMSLGRLGSKAYFGSMFCKWL